MYCINYTSRTLPAVEPAVSWVWDGCPENLESCISMCDRGAFVPAAGNRSSHSLGSSREEVSASFSILALLSWVMELEGLHSEHPVPSYSEMVESHILRPRKLKSCWKGLLSP